MSKSIESVTTKIVVPLRRQDAFELFTARFGSWWPREYSYSGELLVGILLGTAQDDWCYELGPNGFRCDFGRIVELDAPSKIMFTWQIGPKSVPQPNPSKSSLVSVTFVECGARQTIVSVEHSGFAKHGDGAAQYRAEMASEYGWPLVLKQYLAAAQQV